MDKGSVGIIGAGFAGLAAARYLSSEGFAVTLFESHSDIGGQWNRFNPRSGVWPQMRTNTAKFVTKLSDVQYPDSVKLFPRNSEVLDMINEFADLHDLRRSVRLSTTVTGLRRVEGGFEITSTGLDGERVDVFSRVVISSGRYNCPDIPDIPGLDSFSGSEGVIHAFRYKHPERYRDKRVIVCGGSISALEIVSDLAMMGTERAYLSQRRQRYVMPKMVAGTPIEYFVFTRGGGLSIATTTVEDRLAAQKEELLRLAGDPVRYGAPAPHEDIEHAGVTCGQHYYNLVAEDRIDVRQWIARVDGTHVTFTDGYVVEADGIIVGTGFDLDLPYLHPEIADAVNLDTRGLDLAEFTFAPGLDGLAFMGLWSQVGPYPVVLEQQARYIAYSWSGAIDPPTQQDLVRGVQACRDEQHHVGYRSQHEMAIRFGRLAGVDPGRIDDEDLQRILSHSAVTGEMFRIVGHDRVAGAEETVRADMRRYAPPAVLAELEMLLPAPIGAMSERVSTAPDRLSR